MPGKAKSKIELIVEAQVRKALSELKKTENGIDHLSGSAKEANAVFRKATGALGGFVGALSVKEMIGFTLEVAKLGDQMNQIQSPFDKLVTAAGKNVPGALNDLRKAVRGTVSDLELMQRTGAAMDAFIASGMDASQAFEATQKTMDFLYRYSVKFGKNYKELMRTVFTGLQRGSALFLDDVGIMINQTDKQFRGLTDTEKKAKVVQVALQQMAEKNALLGDVSEGAVVKINKQIAAWENFKIALGQLVTGPVSDMIDAVDVLDGWTKIFDDTKVIMLNQKLSGVYERIVELEKARVRMLHTPAAHTQMFKDISNELDEAKKKAKELEHLLGRGGKDDSLTPKPKPKAPEVKDASYEKELAQLRLKLALNKIELNNELDKFDKMRAAVKVHYDFERRAAQGKTDKIRLLNQLEADELAKIDQKEVEAAKLKGEKLKKIKSDAAKFTPQKSPVDDLNEELVNLHAFYATKMQLAGDNAEAVAGYEEELTQKIKEAYNSRAEAVMQYYFDQHEMQGAFYETAMAGYDSFAAHLLDTEMSGKEKREAIWADMQQAFINSLANMLKKYVATKLTELMIDTTAEKAKTAAKKAGVAQRVAADATEVASSAASTAANTAEAASGFFSAYAEIPWVGYALAAAAIVGMLAMLAGIGKKSRGGVITDSDLFKGFAPGDEDGLIAVQRGERVMTRKTTALYGRELDAMEQGRPLPAARNAALTLPAGFALSSIPAPQPAPALVRPEVRTERYVERSVPVEGEIVVRTVAPDYADVRDYHIRVNRDINRPDNDYFNTNLQTEANPFDG